MTSRREIAGAGALALPLLLVNAAAVYGQAGWAYDHLIRNWLIAALFAAAVESIGVYLAFEAHAALMAGDASARLRAGSYLIGALAGVLNYAHFAGPAYRPTPLAVTFATLSSISPWLWAIRSRSMNRARLRELGQVDPRAVRFAALRWLLFPIRTVKAFRVAVWHGIVTPAEAVARSGVRAPGVPAQRVEPVAVEPAPPAPGEALEITALGTPVEVADPASLPVPLPQVTTAAPSSAPVAAEPTRPPARKATLTQAEVIRRVVATFRASGVEPQASAVAAIVGTDNISHVTRVMRKASTAAELTAVTEIDRDKAEWLDRVMSGGRSAQDREDVEVLADGLPVDAFDEELEDART